MSVIVVLERDSFVCFNLDVFEPMTYAPGINLLCSSKHSSLFVMVFFSAQSLMHKGKIGHRKKSL